MRLVKFTVSGMFDCVYVNTDKIISISPAGNNGEKTYIKTVGESGGNDFLIVEHDIYYVVERLELA